MILHPNKIRQYINVKRILVRILLFIFLAVSAVSYSVAFDSHEEKAAAIANLITQYATRFHCSSNCSILKFDHGSPIVISLHVDKSSYLVLKSEISALLKKYNLVSVAEYSDQDSLLKVRIRNILVSAGRDEIKINCDVRYLYNAIISVKENLTNQSKVENYNKRILECALPRVGYPEYSVAIRGDNEFLFDIYVAVRAEFDISGVRVDEFRRELLTSMESNP